MLKYNLSPPNPEIVLAVLAISDVIIPDQFQIISRTPVTERQLTTKFYYP